MDRALEIVRMIEAPLLYVGAPVAAIWTVYLVYLLATDHAGQDDFPY